jgi:hypothetical protein
VAESCSTRCLLAWCQETLDRLGDEGRPNVGPLSVAAWKGRHDPCRREPVPGFFPSQAPENSERQRTPAMLTRMAILNPCLGDSKGKCSNERAAAFNGVECRRLFRCSLTQNANTRSNALSDVLMNDVQIFSSVPRSSFGNKPEDS